MRDDGCRDNVGPGFPESVAGWERCLAIEGFWRNPCGGSFRPSRDIVHAIIARVAATGRGPGISRGAEASVLTDEALRRRREVAEWMWVNGAAVVGCEPGACDNDSGVCYTRKAAARYAFVVPPQGEGRPPPRVLLTAWRPASGSSIALLGCEEPLVWTRVASGVDVCMPVRGLPCDFAWCLELTEATD